jgi:hypothetical protein
LAPQLVIGDAAAYYELKAGPAIFELTVSALVEGNSICAAGRIIQIDKDTVCDWLNRAAHQCWLAMLYLATISLD